MNHELLQYISAKTWMIDPIFGYKQFCAYRNKVNQVKSGLMTKEDAFQEAKALQGSIVFKTKDGSTEIGSLDNLDFSAMPKGSIATLTYSGVMSSEDGLCSYGVNSYVAALYALYAADNVVGIRVDMNSGGGEAVSGFNFASAVSARNKPVIFTGALMASAAYMAATTSDGIYAYHDASEFGSIGAYYTFDKEFLQTFEEKYVTAYAKQSTNKNAALRAAVKDDMSLFEDQATDFASLFIKAVKSSRLIDPDTSKETFAGGMFFAKDAQKRGLIDGVITMNKVDSIILKSVKKYTK